MIVGYYNREPIYTTGPVSDSMTLEVEYPHEPEQPDPGDTIPDADTDPVPEPDPEGD